MKYLYSAVALMKTGRADWELPNYIATKVSLKVARWVVKKCIMENKGKYEEIIILKYEVQANGKPSYISTPYAKYIIHINYYEVYKFQYQKPII